MPVREPTAVPAVCCCPTLGSGGGDSLTIVIHLRFRLSPCSGHGIVAASHLTRKFSVQAVLPNPSLKLTPNGMARRPVRAGASPHFARPRRRTMPLGAA